MKETKDFEGLKAACLPAIEWLEKFCNPHVKIIIDMGRIELVEGKMGIPLEYD